MKYPAFLLCLLVSTTQGSLNVTKLCDILPNGVKFQDPTNCTQWFDCVDGALSQVNACTNGTYFDKQNQTCVTKEQATCNQDLCAHQPNGIFIADPTSCTSYLYCSNGVSVRGTCSKGFNFNPTEQVCKSPLAYSCTNTTLNYEQLCLLIPDNVFLGDSEDCQGWYTCNKNIPSKGECSPGYLFDVATATCNFIDNVQCGNRSTSGITTAQTPKSFGECSNAGTYISDNKTCSGYYYCFNDGKNGSMLLFGECPTGFFDPSHGGACVNRTQVNCTYDRCVGNVKWTSVANSDCKAYYMCANKYTGYCPENHPYFDEVTQQCVNTTITYPSCV